MIGPLTYLDATFIALAIISGLLALYRGLSREILAVLSWIAAAITAAIFWYRQEKLAADMAQQMGVELLIAKIVLCTVSALVVLVIVHLITSRISDSVLDSQVGMIDRIPRPPIWPCPSARCWLSYLTCFMPSFTQMRMSMSRGLRTPNLFLLIKSTGKSIRAFLDTRIVPLLKRG